MRPPTTEAEVRVLGPNVRQRREALGLTIETVAERASVPAGWLARLELNKIVDPDIRGLERLAASLDTTLLALLTMRAGLAVMRGGRNDHDRYAPLVATADWPWRLVAATRINFFLADASGNVEDAEFWRGALAITVDLYRKGAADAA